MYKSVPLLANWYDIQKEYIHKHFCTHINVLYKCIGISETSISFYKLGLCIGIPFSDYGMFSILYKEVTCNNLHKDKLFSVCTSYYFPNQSVVLRSVLDGQLNAIPFLGNQSHSHAIVPCVASIRFSFWRYITMVAYLTFESIFQRPSIYFSLIVKSRSNPFLKPTSTGQCVSGPTRLYSGVSIDELSQKRIWTLNLRNQIRELYHLYHHSDGHQLTCSLQHVYRAYKREIDIQQITEHDIYFSVSIYSSSLKTKV